MLSLLVMLSLSQAGGLVMWTDSEGVVHVDEPRNAPRSAKVLTGDGYSRVDDDARPLVLADGGTREDDSAWWQGRFVRVRQALASAQRREDDARQVLLDATREVCATATAEASTAIDVWSARGGTVVSRGNSLVPLRGGQSARFSDRVTNSTKRCERGTASAGQRAALREATDARVVAEAAVRALEAEARRASLPLRYWR